MNKTYKGTIKNFNGKFGFLQSELGDTFFHKSGIVGKTSIDKGDEVEFKIEPSQRKEGSLQAYEITLIKKFEKPSIPLVNPILGIVKWFNNKKGFGLIAAPKNTDYFLHKSNINSGNLTKGDMVVFEQKTEKQKKVASNCKKVIDYEDFKIALAYLFKEDNITIEYKIKKIIQHKMNYSIWSNKTGFIEVAILQILNDKKTDDRLKFISDYFRDYLTDKPAEEQLKYFKYIKIIFENLKNDKTIILSSFFSRYFEFLKNDTELCYVLWLEGYIQEKDLSYIAQQIEKEPINSSQNPFKKTFEKLTDPNEQEIVLKEFLEIIDNIDNEKKYKRIKYLSDLSELDEKVKETFLMAVYNQSDSERQYLLWLDGHTTKKDLSYIAQQIKKKFIRSYYDPIWDPFEKNIKKIFEKITNPNEQEILLKKFLEIMGSIDNAKKYKRIKYLSNLSELDEKVKVAFLMAVYNQSDSERQYLLWFDGYAQKKDLSYIAQQIEKEPINSSQNPFKKTFEKLTDPNEQEVVLKEFLEIMGSIDNEKKYKRIKYLSDLSELDEKVKKAFLMAVYNQSDSERQYLLWLDDHTTKKDLNYIAQQIKEEEYYYEKIFKKLTNPNEQDTVLKEFLEIIGSIDNEEKYRRIEYLSDLSELDEKVKKAFLMAVYNQSDSERQYLLWLDGYTQEKDLNYIAQQIKEEEYYYEKIFKKLTNPNEQKIVLEKFLEIMGNIDNEEKYRRIEYLSDLSELDEKVKETFLMAVYNQSDSERQYLLWLNGYTQEKDLNYIIQQIEKEPITSFNTLSIKIFEKLTDSNEQDTVLKELLEIMGSIDNEEKYKRIKYLSDLSELNEKVKEAFLMAVYNQSDSERQYLLWLNGYTQEKDLNYIIQQIEKEPITSFNTLSIKIFEKLTDPKEQDTVLKELLEIMGSIDNEEKYKRIKFLFDLSELDEKVKEAFLMTVYNQSNSKRQYLLWLDGYAQKKDLSYIAQQIEKEPINSSQNPFKKIFEKLTDPNEQEIVLKEFLEIIGNIDDKEKYRRIKYLINISELDQKVKNNLLAFIENNIYHQVDQFLNYFQFIKEDKHEQIIYLFNNLDIISLYLFYLELLYPLAKINTHYHSYKGYSYLKIYLEKKDYIHEINEKYGINSVFSYKGVLLTESHFETKIAFFRTISSYIEDNLNRIEDTAKALIKTGNFELISKLLEYHRFFYQVYNQICSDLQIKESKIPNIESCVVDVCDTAQLLKLWVDGLIEYFNFNTYCFYYFTLSLEERKIFNKKAKTKMGEEIKASMLKKREPWQFVEKAMLEKNSEIEIYTASWKSIWFGNGVIRICMDNKPTFSQQYKWDFSEEKFNFLYEYISGRRLKELKISAKGNSIKNIQGLEELEEIIWKILIIKEVESSNGSTIKKDGPNRIPVNMLLRNQCIQLLNKFQLKKLEPTRVLEKTFNIDKRRLGVDVSLLYSIPINEDEVAIIWESLELEKAKVTHIFKCLRIEYESIFSEIENYLSKNLKVRSTLNSKETNAIQQQKKLKYICRIDHDNFSFDVWKKSLYEVLPELKSFVLPNDTTPEST